VCDQVVVVVLLLFVNRCGRNLWKVRIVANAASPTFRTQTDEMLPYDLRNLRFVAKNWGMLFLQKVEEVVEGRGCY
jgi:hypothetical protein